MTIHPSDEAFSDPMAKLCAKNLRVYRRRESRGPVHFITSALAMIGFVTVVSLALMELSR